MRAMTAAAEAERMDALAEIAMEISVLDEDEAVALLFKVSRPARARADRRPHAAERRPSAPPSSQAGRAGN